MRLYAQRQLHIDELLIDLCVYPVNEGERKKIREVSKPKMAKSEI
jgi:hypothetical protein